MSDEEWKVVPLYPPRLRHLEDLLTKGPESERKLWRAILNDDDLGCVLRTHLLFEFGLNAVLKKHGRKGDDETFAGLRGSGGDHLQNAEEAKQAFNEARELFLKAYQQAGGDMTALPK